MKIDTHDPPREFVVGTGTPVRLRHCADVSLEADEQITFTTGAGGEYDVVRKSWGFYATPSVNSRLLRFGLRAMLVRNEIGHYFVVLVERGQEATFDSYCRSESLVALPIFDG